MRSTQFMFLSQNDWDRCLQRIDSNWEVLCLRVISTPDAGTRIKCFILVFLNNVLRCIWWKQKMADQTNIAIKIAIPLQFGDVAFYIRRIVYCGFAEEDTIISLLVCLLKFLCNQWFQNCLPNFFCSTFQNYFITIPDNRTNILISFLTESL